jgi:hypothetical protein
MATVISRVFVAAKAGKKAGDGDLLVTRRWTKLAVAAAAINHAIKASFVAGPAVRIDCRFLQGACP